MSKKLLYLMSFVVALCLPVSSTGAGEFLIDNPGFEDPVLADDDWDYSLDNQGWGYFDNDGYIGSWNPKNADYVGEAYEGENVGWAESGTGVPGGFAQVLLNPEAVLKAGRSYTLTVAVGAARTYTSAGYKVQLLAGGTPHTPGAGDYTGPVIGGTLLAEDDNTLHPIKAGTFEVSTVRYTYNPALHSHLLGERLQIRLLALVGGAETEFDDVKLSWEGSKASNPNPPDNAVDVPVDVNLGWTRGKYCEQDEVYFGTDPCALPLVATIPSAALPPLYNPPVDLVAETTYYWQVDETDSNTTTHTGDLWTFETVSGEAQVDYPFDGAVIGGEEVTYLGDDYIWTRLIFFPGATAVKHTGYFSEDYSKVDSRAPDANLGDPPLPSTPGWENAYAAGHPQIPPAVETLVRGTKYYWTVDATDTWGNIFSGDIWEFTILGYYAYAPSPPNEAVFINTDVLLRWLPGFGAEDHDIYMGTSWEDVNNARYDSNGQPPEFVDTRSDPNFQTSGLPYKTKFYWRVDEVNGRSPFSEGTYYYGDVWCFTTVPEGLGTIREDLWWNVAAGGIDSLYNDPRFPGSPDETRSLTTFDSGYNLANNYGGMIHGWLHPAYSGDYKFWISADDVAELYLSTDDAPANAVLIANAPDWCFQYQWHYYFEQVSASIPLVGGQKYYIRACWKEGSSDDFCAVAWQGPDQPIAPVYGSAAAVIDGSRLSPFVQLWAHDPDPRDDQASVPAGAYTLGWGLGDHAAQHDVYFGTDKTAVENADISDITGIYKGRIGPNSLLVALAAAEFYHWRVDEVNSLGPDPGLWKGATWTFRTEGAAGGLLGLYYHWDGYQPDNPIGPPNPFQVFVMSRIDPEVNFIWPNGTTPGTNSPDPSINTNYFACKWVGHVECPVNANYTFTTRCDDGARLFIDGQEIIPVAAWSQGGMRNYSGDIVLSAGLHDIEMQMYEREGGAGAELRWSAIPTNPSDEAISQQIIPPIWLWPPLFASGPRPPDGATIDERKPMLEWMPGFNADSHELYFSDNFNDVNNRNSGIKETLNDPCRPYLAVPRLELGETYYWLVDEVKSSPPDRWNARTVWSFTISECISLDNMEAYNDSNDLKLVWRDGYADVVWTGSYPYVTLAQGGSSGSNLNVSTAVGSPTGAGPIPPTSLNDEAMVLRYDNDGWTYTGLPGDEKWVYDAPYYSEIEANTVGDNSLDVGQTWDTEGVKSLSLSFQGHPVSDGSYNYDLGWPAYTLYGRGRDIGGRHDEFYYFSKYPFIGDGSVQVQVLRMDNTHPGALAGVMIREKWTPYSKYAAVFMTPGQGVTFQYRDAEDGPTTSITKPGVSGMQYVRLVRNISGTFEAKHSPYGFVWQDVNAPGAGPKFPPIAMGTIDDPNIYAGSAVSSHNANQICSADFNDLAIIPLPLNYVFGNIGTNDPEQLYVVLSDGVNTSVVEHDDPNAATLTTWQEWNIALTDFTTVNPALNLDGIKKLYLGFGDRADPCLGGSGAIYVDDIRACPPRCVPAFAQMLGDIATPYDCTVDEKDVRVLAADWLLYDQLLPTTAPDGAKLLAYWPLDTDYSDYSGSGFHGTPMGGASLIADTERGNVLSLDGSGDYVDCGNPTALDFGTGNWTVCAWVKTTQSGTGDQNKGNIIGKGGDNSGGHRYALGVGEATEAKLTITTDDNASKRQATSSISINDGEWHHVVGMRDVNSLRVYVDSIPDGTNNNVPVGYDLSGTSQHNAYIGTITNNSNSTTYKYLIGSVEEVRIYSYALSELEVRYLAADGAAGVHIPINSPADLYQGEPQGQQWINFKDYCLIADQYLEKLLWPTP